MDCLDDESIIAFPLSSSFSSPSSSSAAGHISASKETTRGEDCSKQVSVGMGELIKRIMTRFFIAVALAGVLGIILVPLPLLVLLFFLSPVLVLLFLFPP